MPAGIRGGVVAMLLASAVPLARQATVRWPVLWVPLLLSLLTPSVVVAFAYTSRFPGGSTDEIGYVLLVALRLFPIAVVVQALLPPPPLSPAARHCNTLAGIVSVSALLHGPLRNAAVVGGLTFVLAFQEFDLATLFTVPSWTVAIYDYQVGGAPLSGSLGLATVPVLLELTVLGAVVWLLRRTAVDSGLGDRPLPVREAGGRPGLVLIGIAGLVICIIPAALLLPDLARIPLQLHFVSEIQSSIVLATGAVLCCAIVTRSCRLAILVVLCVPGLSGGLVLALLVHAVFQLPGLRVLNDSPLPILTGWTLLLLPLATVLRLALERLTPAPALHAAKLLDRSASARHRKSARRLFYTLRGAHVGMAAVILFTIACFEVVAADLLAPSNMMPAAPRLYNMMHYGQSGGLGAMVLAMGLSTVACGGIGFGLWRLGHRRFAG